jgi:hypothetical protein
MTAEPGRVVIYKKDSRVPIAKVVPEPPAEPKEPTMPTEDPYGPAADRYQDAAMIAKHYQMHPGDYDQHHAPKVKSSAVSVVLGELAKSDDPRSIAVMLEANPLIYDALVETEAKRSVQAKAD